MSKKDQKCYYVIDHANKLLDRELGYPRRRRSVARFTSETFVAGNLPVEQSQQPTGDKVPDAPDSGDSSSAAEALELAQKDHQSQT